MVGLIIILIVITGTISWLQASAINKMKHEHPDYKDEDFLNWNRENDDWDNVYTENEL